MSHLTSLTLSPVSRREPLSSVARRRLNLLRKLDVQIRAAEAELRDEEFLQEVRRWVRNEEGDRHQVTTNQPVRRWWWRHHTGAWMITLRHGSKELPINDKDRSIEVGEITNLVVAFQTLRSAVMAGELDGQLELLSPVGGSVEKKRDKTGSREPRS